MTSKGKWMDHSRWFGWTAAFVAVLAACSGADSPESIRSTHAALTSIDRVLGFEGSVGGAPGADWTAAAGTTVATSATAFAGSQSLALSNSYNPSATSIPLTGLGPVGSNATVEVSVPLSLAGQGWLGQIQLFFTSNALGFQNVSTAAVPLVGPAGEFQQYTLPLPQQVISGLAAQPGADLAVRIQLSSPNTTDPFLIDALSLGQSSTGSGGTGGTSSTGGSSSGGTSTGGTGGTTSGGSGGTSGGTGGASGASGGTGGTSTGGTAGSADTPFEFSFQLPRGVRRQDVALATTNGDLYVDDRVQVVEASGGFAPVSGVAGGGGVARIGVDADTGNLWSGHSLALADRAEVHGDLLTSGTVARGVGSLVDGALTENADIGPLHEVTWSVTFPGATNGAVNLDTGSRALLPAAYDSVSVKTGAHLQLSSGTYTFNSLTVEPGGVLEIDNPQPVFLYMRDAFTMRGSSTRTVDRPNVLYGIAGVQAVSILGQFRGIVVAPRAQLSLESATSGYIGTFLSFSMTVHQDSIVTHEAFDPAQFCSPGTCSSFCPCESGGVCETDADCDIGLVCAPGLGPSAGQARGTSVCQPPVCMTNARSTACGSSDAACGSCQNYVTCAADADCPAGDICGTNNWVAFPDATRRVCWPSICESSAASNCGGITALCGACVCQPNCSAKACGDSPDDGCGGQCVGFCHEREAGCTADFECGTGLVCIHNGGPQIGLAEGVNVCLPTACRNSDRSQIPCGSGTDAECGLCTACTAACAGRQCGPDPNHCQESCGDCTAGSFCDDDGTSAKCVPSIDETQTMDVPDGLGGTRTVTSLARSDSTGVGTLDGTFAVSDRGAATYTVPLAVPPTSAGLDPQLALAYSSITSSGEKTPDGFLGVGWSVQGLSTISRCGKTVAQDLQSDGIHYDGTDQFCLDGQRLVAISGDYGGDGTEYRTEVDSFTRIISRGVATGGPMYFEVHTPSGLLRTYGQTDNSSIYANTRFAIKRAWALTKVNDLSGNEIQYEYTKFEQPASEVCVDAAQCGTQEFFPSDIWYGLPTIGHQFERHIKFIYKPRVHASKKYASGLAVSRLRLLDRIQTSVTGNLAREYRFDYDQLSVAELLSIKECDGRGVCKPPTTFTYRADNGLSEPTVAQFPGIVVSNGVINRPIVLDVNGDGYADVLVPLAGGGHISWDLYKGTGNPSQPFERIASQLPIPSTVGDITIFGDFRYAQDAVFDGNQDGLDDVLVRDPVVPAHEHYSWFTPQPPAFDFQPGSSIPIVSQGNAWFVDADGDGLTDIVECREDSSHPTAPQNLFLYKGVASTTSGASPFSTTARALGAFGQCPMFAASDATPSPTFRVDTDGDGRQNLVIYDQKLKWGALKIPAPANPNLAPLTSFVVNSIFRNSDGSTNDALQPDPQSPIVLVDVNGDGLKDVYALNVVKSQEPILWLNTGGAAIGDGFRYVGYGALADARTLGQAVVLDYDGDGLEDMIKPSDEDGDQFLHWDLYLGSDEANTYGLTRLAGLTIGGFPAPLVGAGVHRHVPLVADFNGDSSPDLMLLDGSGQGHIYYGTGARAHLLESITDGLGSHIQIDYDPGGGAVRTYTPRQSCSWPTRCVRDAGPLVSDMVIGRVASTSLTTAEHRFVYRYEDGRADIHGHGWLGFGKRFINEFDDKNQPLNDLEIDYDNSTPLSTELAFANSMDPAHIVGHRYVYPFRGMVKHRRFDTVAVQSPELEDQSWKRAVDTTNTFTYEVATTGGRPFPTVLLSDTRQVDVPAPFDSHDGPDQLVVETCTSRATDGFGNTTQSVTYHTHVAAEGCGVLSPQELADRAVSGIVDDYSIVTTTFQPSQSELDDWLIRLPKERRTLDAYGDSLLLPVERRSTYTYYDTGLLHTVTRQPEFSSTEQLDTTFEYDRAKVTKITQLDTVQPQRVTSVHYDAQGYFPVEIVDASGQTSQMRFEPFTGQLVLAADPNGIVEQRQYDGFGRIVQRAVPGRASHTRYESASTDTSEAIDVPAVLRSVVETDGAGRSEEELDSFGRVVRTRRLGYDSPSGGETIVAQEFEYDTLGRLHQMARPHVPGDASQGVIVREYDFQNRLTSETYPNGSVVNHFYATRNTLRAGFEAWTNGIAQFETLQATQNPRGFVDAQLFDQRAALVAAVDAQDHQSRYGYAAFGALRSIQDSLSHVISYDTDPYGRVLAITDPDRGGHIFHYDGYDQVTDWQKNNSLIQFAYDALGRTTKRTSPDGVSTWIYDAHPTDPGPNEVGRLVEYNFVEANAADPSFVERYRYEAPVSSTFNRGLLQSVATTIDSETFTSSIDFDDFGRPQTLHYPNNGPSVAYRYDAHGGQLRAVAPADNSGSDYWRLESADQGIRPTVEAFGNGTHRNTTYRPTDGRVSTIDITDASGISALQVSYDRYDENGNPTSMMETAAGHTTTDLSLYDSLDRLFLKLRSVDGRAPTSADSFSYDDIGNITSNNDLVYTYDHAAGLLPHAPNTVGDESYTYDTNGNLQSRHSSTRTQTLDNFTTFDLPRTLLTQTSVSTAQVDLTYDGRGTRIKKHVAADGATPEQTTIYAGALERTVTAAATQERFPLTGPAGSIGWIERSGPTDAGHIVYSHTDALGSPRVYTDANGAVVHTQRFTALGSEDTPATWRTSDANLSSIHDGFTGHEHDPESGIINMRGRLYDPQIGRFLSADPFTQAPGWSQGLNPYSYVFNNPLKFVDPSGFDGEAVDADFSNNPLWVYGGLSSSSTDTYSLNAPPDAAAQPENVDPGMEEYSPQASLDVPQADAPIIPTTNPYAPPPTGPGAADNGSSGSGGTGPDVGDLRLRIHLINGNYALQKKVYPSGTSDVPIYLDETAAQTAAAQAGSQGAGSTTPAPHKIYVGSVAPAVRMQPAAVPSPGGVATEVVAERAAAEMAAEGVGALEGSALRAESALQGSLLRQQLAAEEIAGARLPTQITGYTGHGLDQAVGREGVGVSVRAIGDAVNNPLSIFGKVNGTFGFVGRDATVVLNANGEVVSTWATGSAGFRISF